MHVRHLLLDRDGVLNREAPGGGWISDPESWQWEDGALEGLELAARFGVRVSVVSNQSGIGRGVVSAHQVEAVHRRMTEEASAAGGRIDAVLICPHAPEQGCSCRKPAPGLLFEAIEAAGIPASHTLLVGDADRDLAAAEAAGVKSVLVRTGKGTFTERTLSKRDTRVFDSLGEAVVALMASRAGEVPIDTIDTIEEQFEEHRRVFEEASKTLPGVLREVISAVWSSLDQGGCVLVCGNGGSAADAQHLAAELVCRVRTDRRALPAVALTTDTSALTAIANDYGYERVFSRQLEALASAGDVLVAISTSGSSANVIAAAEEARKLGCTVVAMTGRDGGELAPLADHLLAAPASVVSRIQEIHSLCIHVLAEALEALAASQEHAP